MQYGHHLYKVLTTPKGHQVRIDYGIVDLIVLLWRLQFDTVMSCENWGKNSGRIWIAFSTADELMRFGDMLVDRDELLTSNDPTNLSNGIVSYWEPDANWQEFRDTRSWHYRIIHTVRERDSDPFSIEWGFDVAFPRTDYHEVMVRLKKHLVGWDQCQNPECPQAGMCGGQCRKNFKEMYLTDTYGFFSPE